MYSSPENHNDIPHGARESEEQYDFFDELEAEKDPIKKFPLDFGEEALFDAREPNILEIYGGAHMNTATVHFDETGHILDVTVRGPMENEAQIREAFTAKAAEIIKRHRTDVGL